MAKIRTDDYQALQTERRAAAELRAKVNAEADLMWDDEAWQREMAAEFFQNIVRGFEFENLLGYFLDTETVGKADEVFVKETYGLRATWVAVGGRIQASSLQQDVFPLPRDRVAFAVEELDEKLRLNFGVSGPEMQDLGRRQMDGEVNAKVLRTFQATIDVGSDSYETTAGAPAATLNSMIREVFDETETGTVTVVGRSPAIGAFMDDIADSNLFAPETNERLISIGVLGVYRRARIIELKNYKDDQENPKFPANETYVIAKDAGKAAFFGGLEGEAGRPMFDPYWRAEASRDFGMVIHHPERMRRHVNSSIAA